MRPIPLRPTPEVRPAEYLKRAAFAHVWHFMSPQYASAEDFAAKRWDDNVTPIVLRGVTAPAKTTDPAWAGVLAQNVVGDFVASLAPLSAAARLFAAAPRATLAGAKTITFPGRNAPLAPDLIPWVEEGMPAPVLKIQLKNASVLGPTKKLMCIVVMTRETAESGNAETVLSTLLQENASLSLDATVFSDQPATAARPAGLLNGVTPINAAANGDDAAMATDLSALSAAIAQVTSGLAFVAHPAQANAIRLRRGTALPADIPVWGTVGVPAGTVIALDPACIVSAFGVQPEFSSSKETVLHMEDTTPGDVVAGTPTKSLFQTDCIALKIILRSAFASRVAGSIAYVTGTTW